MTWKRSVSAGSLEQNHQQRHQARFKQKITGTSADIAVKRILHDLRSQSLPWILFCKAEKQIKWYSPGNDRIDTWRAS